MDEKIKNIAYMPIEQSKSFFPYEHIHKLCKQRKLDKLKTRKMPIK